MYDWIMSFIETIKQNPIAYSIFGVGLMGTIGYWCKRLPVMLISTISDRFTVSVEITNTPAAPDIIPIFEREFHSLSSVWSFTNNFQLGKNKDDSLYLMIGTHRLCIARLQGMWCTIWKYEHAKPDMHGVRHYTYRLRFYTRNVKSVESYMRDVYLRSVSDPTGEFIVVHTKSEWSYSDFNKIKKRKLTCPAASPHHRAILDHIRAEFDDDKILKHEKLGVLLYGAPGCGKSKLIYQLASELGINVYLINIKDFTSDAEFCTTLDKVRIPGILLFEDIDCVVKDRNTPHQKKDNENYKPLSGVNLSTILNVFDGLLTQDKQFVIATTNHPEKLDPALIRTGRFDLRFELYPLNQIDIASFIATYYRANHKDDYLSYLHGIESMTIADLDYICRTYPLEEVGTEEWCKAMQLASIPSKTLPIPVVGNIPHQMH